MNNIFAMKSCGDHGVAGWCKKYDGFATNSVEHIVGDGTREDIGWQMKWAQREGSYNFFLFGAK